MKQMAPARFSEILDIAVDEISAETSGRATCAEIARRLHENVRNLPPGEFPAFLHRLLENGAGGRMIVRAWMELELEVQGVGSESVLVRTLVRGADAEAN